MDRTLAPDGRWSYDLQMDGVGEPRLFFLYRPGHYDILYKPSNSIDDTLLGVHDDYNEDEEEAEEKEEASEGSEAEEEEQKPQVKSQVSIAQSTNNGANVTTNEDFK